MYAILDIETTGGKFNEEGITEIAIYRFDGHEVVDQFISLVNPERPIQPYVARLTGLNNKMLETAPKFFEIAKRIVEITENCILVAHNAQFDARILATEFGRLGYEFDRSSLCTVELAQVLLPEQKQYSLGKLVRSLGIPMSDRHRASGDALATVELFKLLLSKDSEKKIISEVIQAGVKETKKLEPHVLELLEPIPATVGVYYLHDDKGKIIYIGRSRNLNKRVRQHFTSSKQQSRRMQKHIHQVSFEKTGNELIASLKVRHELRKLNPLFNPPPRERLFEYALYTQKDQDGFTHWILDKADGRKKMVSTFTNYRQGLSFLKILKSKFNIHNSYIHSSRQQWEEIHQRNSQVQLDKASHNRISDELANQLFLGKSSFVLLDKGRQTGEKSIIALKQGKVIGYGYTTLNHQLYTPSILNAILVDIPSDANTLHLVRNYHRKHIYLKRRAIVFEENSVSSTL